MYLPVATRPSRRAGAKSQHTTGERNKRSMALRVLKQFRLIYGSARQQFRDIEATCKLSGSQLWMLQEIQSAPGIGVTELAQRLSIHQSTCSQLADKLFAHGYVLKTRSAEDQRRVGLSATPAARRLLHRAPGSAEGLLPEALTAMRTDSLVRLSAQLEELISRLRVRDERASGQPLSELLR